MIPHLQIPNRLTPAIPTFLFLCIHPSTPLDARTTIFWNVTFYDVINASGYGFDDPVLGATRRDTFSQVTAYVSSQLSGSANLDFTVNPSRNDGTGALASAGSIVLHQPERIHQRHTPAARPYRQRSVSRHPGRTCAVRFRLQWNSGLSAPSPLEYDLFSIALHEITHALGFVSLADSSGASYLSHSDTGVFSELDSFLVIGGTTALYTDENGATFAGSPSDLTSNNLYFNGSSALAANGGNPVGMYAPATFKEGSSISHIDPSHDAVMNPEIGRGESKRTYTALDLAILGDIGWSIATIPEPSYSFLFPLALFTMVLRRQRHKPSMPKLV